MSKIIFNDSREFEDFRLEPESLRRIWKRFEERAKSIASANETVRMKAEWTTEGAEAHEGNDLDTVLSWENNVPNRITSLTVSAVVHDLDHDYGGDVVSSVTFQKTSDSLFKSGIEIEVSGYNPNEGRTFISGLCDLIKAECLPRRAVYSAARSMWLRMLLICFAVGAVFVLWALTSQSPLTNNGVAPLLGPTELNAALESSDVSAKLNALLRATHDAALSRSRTSSVLDVPWAVYFAAAAICLVAPIASTTRWLYPSNVFIWGGEKKRVEFADKRAGLILGGIVLTVVLGVVVNKIS